MSTDDFSSLKARAAMHNTDAYLAGWREIHDDGQPMTVEQRYLLMEMFRRVLSEPREGSLVAEGDGDEGSTAKPQEPGDA